MRDAAIQGRSGDLLPHNAITEELEWGQQQRKQNQKRALNFFQRRLCTLQAHRVRERAEQRGRLLLRSFQEAAELSKGAKVRAGAALPEPIWEMKAQNLQVPKLCKKEGRKNGIILTLAKVATMHCSCFH